MEKAGSWRNSLSCFHLIRPLYKQEDCLAYPAPPAPSPQPPRQSPGLHPRAAASAPGRRVARRAARGTGSRQQRRHYRSRFRRVYPLGRDGLGVRGPLGRRGGLQRQRRHALECGVLDAEDALQHVLHCAVRLRARAPPASAAPDTERGYPNTAALQTVARVLCSFRPGDVVARAESARTLRSPS